MNAEDRKRLDDLCRLMRVWILEMTAQAGSGHPTSSLSAVELMASLFFQGHLRYDAQQPDATNNDRVIFSKGHASPLFYTLWAAANEIEADQLATYRQFESPLEGHPTSRFPHTVAATGSLGQGLSIGLGVALASAQLGGSPTRAYVLLGDSEMAEGSQWEAIQLAAHYEVGNLVALLDVNRLGQRGPTMYEHDLSAYQNRIEAFGWKTVVVEDGHDVAAIDEALQSLPRENDRPAMVIARTVKGNGVSFLENEEGWHGKALDGDQLSQALDELGPVDRSLRGAISPPEQPAPTLPEAAPADKQLPYKTDDRVATRDAYGNALVRLAPALPRLVVLDGEVCNSTRAKNFRDSFPERFYEMYIAEQNMVGAATGMALQGLRPFVSTFAAFFTRAFDQIRMSVHSDAPVTFVGSHAGVSIGADGPSQMGLEDVAMFRTIPGSVVLSPCDAVSTERLVDAIAEEPGIAYLRTMRGATPVIYDENETFAIGGSKVLRQSDADIATIVAAGATVHEALKAFAQLQDKNLAVRVVDCYGIKPLDTETLRRCADATEYVVTVEDHYSQGGLGEAVCAALSDRSAPVYMMSVDRKPRSGSPDRLRTFEGISADAIVRHVCNIAEKLAIERV